MKKSNFLKWYCYNSKTFKAFNKITKSLMEKSNMQIQHC